MSYWFHVIALFAIYLLLVQSLNVAVGYTGILSLAHGAFYGLGAYATAIGLQRLSLSHLPALAMGVFVAVLASFLLSSIAFRLQKDRIVLATIGFQVLVVAVIYNWDSVTGGPLGISPIPRLVVGSWAGRGPALDAVVYTLIAIALTFSLLWLLRGALGLHLISVRDDALAAEAVGNNSNRLRSTALGISAAIAGLAGGLYASLYQFIEPRTFSIDISVVLLAAVVIGGAGTVSGAVVGAAFVTLVPELLRFLSIPDTIAPNIRQICFGLMIVVLMIFRPNGLLGRYDLSSS